MALKRKCYALRNLLERSGGGVIQNSIRGSHFIYFPDKKTSAKGTALLSFSRYFAVIKPLLVDHDKEDHID